MIGGEHRPDPDSGGPPPCFRRLMAMLLRIARGPKHVESELEELWRVRADRDGRTAADRWYRRQVLGFLLRANGIATLGARLAPAAGLDALSADVRSALRQLFRRPAATAVSFFILAGALASATVVFSVVDGVVLSPLPYPDPDRLVQVTQVEPGRGADLPNFSSSLLTLERTQPRLDRSDQRDERGGRRPLGRRRARIRFDHLGGGARFSTSCRSLRCSDGASRWQKTAWAPRAS